MNKKITCMQRETWNKHFKGLPLTYIDARINQNDEYITYFHFWVKSWHPPPNSQSWNEGSSPSCPRVVLFSFWPGPPFPAGNVQWVPELHSRALDLPPPSSPQTSVTAVVPVGNWLLPAGSLEHPLVVVSGWVLVSWLALAPPLGWMQINLKQCMNWFFITPHPPHIGLLYDNSGRGYIF